MSKSSKLSRKLVNLLRRTAKQIEQYPEHYEQASWIGAFGPKDNSPFCGTTYCIAGHLVVGAGEKLSKEAEIIEDRAIALLVGLSATAIDRLFSGGATSWPHEFLGMGLYDEPKAKHAAKLLRAIADGQVSAETLEVAGVSK